jgi:hypothetical protein
MKNEKQTAVEWLFDQLPDELRLTKSGFEMLQQAKEMERQQKQNYLTEYFEWHNSMWFVSHTPEDIIEFNETYGGKK